MTVGLLYAGLVALRLLAALVVTHAALILRLVEVTAGTTLTALVAARLVTRMRLQRLRKGPLPVVALQTNSLVRSDVLGLCHFAGRATREAIVPVQQRRSAGAGARRNGHGALRGLAWVSLSQVHQRQETVKADRGQLLIGQRLAMFRGCRETLAVRLGDIDGLSYERGRLRIERLNHPTLTFACRPDAFVVLGRLLDQPAGSHVLVTRSSGGAA